jgi:hypothetical protein
MLSKAIMMKGAQKLVLSLRFWFLELSFNKKVTPSY